MGYILLIVPHYIIMQMTAFPHVIIMSFLLVHKFVVHKLVNHKNN